jgi:hypothetical protein
MSIDMSNLGLDDILPMSKFPVIRSAADTQEVKVPDPRPETPEDTMILYVDIAYCEGGTWNTVQLRRTDVARILNGDNTLDNLPIFAICPATFEGTDCDLRYVYYFSTKTWEIV